MNAFRADEEDGNMSFLKAMSVRLLDWRRGASVFVEISSLEVPSWQRLGISAKRSVSRRRMLC